MAEHGKIWIVQTVSLASLHRTQKICLSFHIRLLISSATSTLFKKYLLLFLYFMLPCWQLTEFMDFYFLCTCIVILYNSRSVHPMNWKFQFQILQHTLLCPRDLDSETPNSTTSPCLCSQFPQRELHPPDLSKSSCKRWAPESLGWSG